MKGRSLTELTQDIVRELLDYDPETGVLRWKERDIKWFKASETRTVEHVAKHWNNKHSGKEISKAIDFYGYRNVKIFGKRYKAHRIIWLWYYGEWPKGVIDHENQNGADNRISNLRDVSQEVNCQNAKKHKNNKSGVSGVYYSKRDKLWQSTIGYKGGRKLLGYFKTFEEAVAKRKEAESR